jgi:hypothetical protein
LGCYQALGALAKGKDPKEPKKKDSKFLCSIAITKNLAEKLGIESGSIKWDAEGLNSNLITAEVHKYPPSLRGGKWAENLSVIDNTFTGASAPVFLCSALIVIVNGQGKQGKARQSKARYIEFAYLEHLSYLCGANDLVVRGLR